ncbi:MAG: chorismate mutase [Draconibacterium sp.]
MTKLKRPNECNSLEEVRGEIDKIDYEIISLFSKRLKYVEEVVNYKNDEEGVIAAARKNQVITDRAKRAASLGLDPIVFQEIYTLLIDRNIQHELELLKVRTEIKE